MYSLMLFWGKFSSTAVEHLVIWRLNLGRRLHRLLTLEMSSTIFETLRDVQGWSPETVPICPIGRRLFVHIIRWRSYMSLINIQIPFW